MTGRPRSRILRPEIECPPKPWMDPQNTANSRERIAPGRSFLSTAKAASQYSVIQGAPSIPQFHVEWVGIHEPRTARPIAGCPNPYREQAQISLRRIRPLQFNRYKPTSGDLSGEQRGFGGTSVLSIQQLSRKSGLLVTFTPRSELRDCIVPRLPRQNRQIEEEPRKIPIRSRGKRACGASACLAESSGS